MASAHTTVRPALESDVPRLAELRWEFRSTYAAPTEQRSAFLARCGRWMRDALSEHGTWHAWLAETGSHVVGNVWLDRIDKIPNPAAEPEVHAYVSNLYVQPQARGRGLGRDLLEAAVGHCRLLRPHAVILWPSERSRSLYERAGFESAADMMTLPIGLGRDG